MGNVRDRPIAIGEVYRAHAQTVARWAARLAGPDLDVEDVVQEVFLAAHRKLPGFRGDSNITTWLYRITENIVRHRRRKERWRQWLRGSAEDVAGGMAALDSGPADHAQRRQATERVYRVLNQMKERNRNVLILFELEELSGEQIAELTGAKLATVWVWLHRARQEFARYLEKLEQPERGETR